MGITRLVLSLDKALSQADPVRQKPGDGTQTPNTAPRSSPRVSHGPSSRPYHFSVRAVRLNRRMSWCRGSTLFKPSSSSGGSAPGFYKGVKVTKFTFQGNVPPNPGEVGRLRMTSERKALLFCSSSVHVSVCVWACGCMMSACAWDCVPVCAHMTVWVHGSVCV